MHATAEVDVIVLEQDHVEETYAVVHSASDAHGLFLQHAHARRGLARVEDARLSARVDESLLVAVGHGGYAAHALADVEHEALGGEEALLASAYREHDVAWAHVVAVVHVHGHFQVRVEAAEHFLGSALAGEDALFLYHQFALAHGVGGDAA